MAQLDEWSQAAAEMEAIAKQVGQLQYTKGLTFSQLAIENPEVLQHVCTKKFGGDHSKVATAYVGMLKACKKMRTAIDESSSEIKGHFTDMPLQLPSNARAIVPFLDTVNPKIPTVTSLLLDSDSVDSEPNSRLRELCLFWRKHVIHLLQVAWLIARYAPVFAMYSMFLFFLFGFLILGTRPELVVDVMFYMITWLPEYLGSAFAKIADRAVLRLTTAKDPMTSGNYTISQISAPDGGGGGFWFVGFMVIGALWRSAPQ